MEPSGVPDDSGEEVFRPSLNPDPGRPIGTV